MQSPENAELVASRRPSTVEVSSAAIAVSKCLYGISFIAADVRPAGRPKAAPVVLEAEGPPAEIEGRPAPCSAAHLSSVARPCVVCDTFVYYWGEDMY